MSNPEQRIALLEHKIEVLTQRLHEIEAALRAHAELAAGAIESANQVNTAAFEVTGRFLVDVVEALDAVMEATAAPATWERGRAMDPGAIAHEKIDRLKEIVAEDNEEGAGHAFLPD